MYACTSLSETDHALIKAEKMMLLYPDSANSIINRINPKSLDNKLRRARYALICGGLDYDKSNDRQDSLLCSAIAYFRNKTDKYPLEFMISQYYAGVRNENRLLHGQAIISFLRSEEVATELNDSYMLGTIYHRISRCYESTYNPVQALEYSELSLEHFKHFDNDSCSRHAMNHLASMLRKTGESDKAITLCNNLIDIATEENDTTLLTESLSSLGAAFIETEQYHLATVVLRRLQTIQNVLSSPDDIRNMGIAYLNTGNIDSAVILSEHLEKIDITEHWLKYLILNNTGQFKPALEELKKVLSNKNNDLKTIISQSSQKQISGYYDRRHRQMKRDFKKERAKRSTLTISGIFFLLIIYLLFQYKARLAHKNMDEAMSRTQELTNQLIVHKKSLYEAQSVINQNKEELSNIRNEALVDKGKLAELQASFNSAFSEQFNLINELCETYYTCKGASNERAKIYSRVMNLLDSLRTDGKLSNDMEQSANKRFNNVMSHLRIDYPQLKQDDCQLFLYLIAGLSPRSISTLFNIKIEAVYNRKAKLKVKLVQQNPDKSGQYISLLS